MIARYPKVYEATAGLGELYHHTRVRSAASILADGQFRLTRVARLVREKRVNPKPYHLSLTRSRAIGYLAYKGMLDKRTSSACIAFDADALTASVKTVPVEYWHAQKKSVNAERPDAMEERVVSDRPTLKFKPSAVLRVCVFLDPRVQQDLRSVRALIGVTKREGIPLQVYDSRSAYLSQRPELALRAGAVKALLGVRRNQYLPYTIEATL